MRNPDGTITLPFKGLRIICSLTLFSLVVSFLFTGCTALQPEKKMVLCGPNEVMRFTSTGHVIDCRTQKIHWI